MRTTMDLRDDLLKRAKKRAADEGVPLREIVERALHGYLAGRTNSRRTYKLRIKPFSSGLQPGVDMNDWASVRDLMDGIE